jgi:hypothetical protein
MEISKRNFCHLGGMTNPELYRKQDKKGRWRYYKINLQAI